MSIGNKNNRVYIFDLDDTLFPTNTVHLDFGKPVLDEIIRCAGVEKKYSLQDIEKIYADCWVMPFDQIALKYKFSDYMYDSIQKAYCELEINHPIHLFDDALVTLNQLEGIKYLVTTGYEKLQNSKIEWLNIRHLFLEVYIDDIGAKERIHKVGYFKKIQCLHNAEIIIIGDNLESEIKAGNVLGLTTVYFNKHNTDKSSISTYTIHSLSELINI